MCGWQKHGRADSQKGQAFPVPLLLRPCYILFRLIDWRTLFAGKGDFPLTVKYNPASTLMYHYIETLHFRVTEFSSQFPFSLLYLFFHHFFPSFNSLTLCFKDKFSLLSLLMPVSCLRTQLLWDNWSGRCCRYQNQFFFFFFSFFETPPFFSP